jgi:ribonuclease P protein component
LTGRFTASEVARLAQTTESGRVDHLGADAEASNHANLITATSVPSATERNRLKRKKRHYADRRSSQQKSGEADQLVLPNASDARLGYRTPRRL